MRVVSFAVTGRPEWHNKKRLAPWGYGDNFKLDLVPLPLLKLTKKIENDKSNIDLRPNSLRDITINFYENSMFGLDPHLDPVADGTNTVRTR